MLTLATRDGHRSGAAGHNANDQLHHLGRILPSRRRPISPPLAYKQAHDMSAIPCLSSLILLSAGTISIDALARQLRESMSFLRHYRHRSSRYHENGGAAAGATREMMSCLYDLSLITIKASHFARANYWQETRRGSRCRRDDIIRPPDGVRNDYFSTK